MNSNQHTRPCILQSEELSIIIQPFCQTTTDNEDDEDDDEQEEEEEGVGWGPPPATGTSNNTPAPAAAAAAAITARYKHLTQQPIPTPHARVVLSDADHRFRCRAFKRK